ncbi:MAG: copper resistance protein CopC, partial [Thermomicrobiales bacterium]|nr:copper resistance protein CopC [Thermomicrobiales bacterium]
MIRVLRLGVFCATLLMLLLASAAGIAAHAALERSEPASGEVLPTAPAEVRIWFTEPLEPRFTRANLLDANGQPAPGGTSQVAPDNDHLLILTLPPDLPDGGYTVAWRNLSAADGHTLQGYFGFAIGAGGAPGAAASDLSAAPDAPRELSRGLALIGLALLLAIAPVTLGVLVPAVRAAPDLADGLTRRLRAYTVAAMALALLGSVFALLAQAAAVAPDLTPPQAAWVTLSGTRYGEVWVWRLLGLVAVSATVVIGLWGSERRSHAALRLAALVGLFVPITFSLVSHAAAQPEGAAAAIVADALHLVAAAIWGGGVVLLAVVLLPALRPFRSGAWRHVLRAAILRFSVLALAAWGILVLSGLYAAWLQVGSLPGLTETPYGRSLLLKGALLTPILALAAWHFWQGRDPARSRLPRLSATLALEALLVAAVLLVVGRLIGQPPAREVLASRAPAHIQTPLAFPTSDGERTATLTITPGAAGNNTFTIAVAGDPLPEKTEGVLRVNLPAQDLGEQELRLPQTAPNTFAADGTELAVAGDWQVTAIIRDIGAFAWTAQSALHVGTSPPLPPVVNPPPHFGSPGIAGMLVLAAGCLALAFGVVAGRQERRLVAIPGGVVLSVAGVALLLAGRLPVASAPEAADAPTIPALAATPATMPEHVHDHDQAQATPEAVALPGIATPTSAGGLTVTLTADTRSAAPTDLTLTVRDAAGAPVTGARVVVFPEMAGMGPSASLTAEEQAPGTYIVTGAPLTMPGAW